MSEDETTGSTWEDNLRKVAGSTHPMSEVAENLLSREAGEGRAD